MISAVRFREVMAATPAPVTVVTTTADDEPAGATVSAFISLSLEPALVGVSLRCDSRLLGLVQARGAYGVNLLAACQRDVALAFAGPGSDRFVSVHWTEEHGLPRLGDCAAWLACEVEAVMRAGDHCIVVGRVADATCSMTPPLVYSHHLFGTNSSIRPNPSPGQTAIFARVPCFDGAFY